MLAFLPAVPLSASHAQPIHTIICPRLPIPRVASLQRPVRTIAPTMAAQTHDATDILALKDRLFAALNGLDRGLTIDADAPTMTIQEAEVEEVIETLEDSTDCVVPTRDARVFGTWKLIYTSSSITRYFGGLTGLQRLLPDGSVGRIRQTIDAEDGTSVFDECISCDVPFRSRRANLLATVTGKIRSTSETRQVWQPETVRLAGFSRFAETWKTLRAFQVADITFLDDQLRITRGQNGSVCVFARWNEDDDDK